MATFKYPKLSGGFATDPAAPKECAQFDNIDLNRDGYAITRQPTFVVNTPGALGSGMITGIGRTVCPAATEPKLMVAKAGTTFYYTYLLPSGASSFALPLSGGTGASTVTIPLTFSSFTVPVAPAQGAVYFETMLDADFNPSVYMATPTWAGGLVKWDGSSGSADYVSGSPASPFTLCSYSGNLYAAGVGNPNILYFSNDADPDTWPSTNAFQVDAKYGPIVALVSQDDRLYIFTQSAILYMVGSPTAPYVGVMHPLVTCSSQSSVSQFGATTTFLGRDNNYYTLAGQVSLISDSIRGSAFGGGTPIYGPTVNAWAAMTPSYFAVRAPQNSLGTGSTTPGLCFMLVNERQRYGYWGRYTYPTNSGVGQAHPFQAVVFYVPEWDALVLGNGVGDLYMQPLMDSVYPYGLSVPFITSDVGTNGVGLAPVTSTLKTFVLAPEDDPSMTNRFIKGTAYGQGLNLSIRTTLYYGSPQYQTYTGNLPPTIQTPLQDFGYSSSVSMVNPYSFIGQGTAGVMPIQWFPHALTGSSSSPQVEFNMIQHEISANNLSLRGLEFDYTPQRRNFLVYS